MMDKNVNLEGAKILVTGACGFIGANLVAQIFKKVNTVTVVGIDNMNDYYDVEIKNYRKLQLDKLASKDKNWVFVKGSIADKSIISELFEKYRFDVVVNLAAQAGVRYSITNPDVYIESNIIGFYNILA